jgi:large subunit ribosomal protein L22
VLRSAVANAEANHGLFGDDLRVSAAYVDVGPTIKRWRPRARGRAARIHKRTCHITIKLAPVPEQVERRRKAEPPAQEKPKRGPRRKAAPKAETEQAAEQKQAEASEPKARSAEDKPKKTTARTRKKKEETEA